MKNDKNIQIMPEVYEFLDIILFYIKNVRNLI